MSSVGEAGRHGAHRKKEFTNMHGRLMEAAPSQIDWKGADISKFLSLRQGWRGRKLAKQRKKKRGSAVDVENCYQSIDAGSVGEDVTFSGWGGFRKMFDGPVWLYTQLLCSTPAGWCAHNSVRGTYGVIRGSWRGVAGITSQRRNKLSCQAKWTEWLII